MTLVVVLGLTACGKRHNADGPSYALPPGTYDVSDPLCAISGTPPAYPEVRHKTALFAFDTLTTHRLEMQGDTSVETIQDKDCTLRVTRGVLQNDGGIFAHQRNRRHVFEPSGCLLQIAHGGLVHDVGLGSSTQFTDSEDPGEDIPFEVVAREAGGYDLTSRDQPDLNEVWSLYGCAKPDRLRLGLGAVPL